MPLGGSVKWNLTNKFAYSISLKYLFYDISHTLLLMHIFVKYNLQEFQA